MEVCVSSPSFRFSLWTFPDGSLVRDVLTRFVPQQEASSDLYVTRDGRLCELEAPLQHGAVYHLEPRLCGGKGGFGSMLRALGAQIEKTTNREACRDLSGRRLRDVNHEKEMAEWLKKQAEREAEKEQRRLERLQRKLAEPKHQFTDPEYQQQCHDLSERLEDSVIRGLQASCSSQVKVDDVSAVKRSSSDDGEQPQKKKKKTPCLWMDVGEVLSSEDEDKSPPSSHGATPTPPEEAEPEQSSSPAGTSRDQMDSPAGTSRDQTVCSAGTSRDQTVRPVGTSRDQMDSPAGTSRDQTVCSAGTSRDQTVRPIGTSRDQMDSPAGTSRDQTVRPVGTSRDQDPAESCCSSQQQGRPAVDLSSLSSLSQLEALGLDVLKEELMSRGLKCGGTLAERAARLFSVRGLNPDQISPALLAKPAKAKRK